MNISDNLILNCDSYKSSHYLQYPPGTEKVFSYIESRGGQFDQIVFFGLQMFLKEYLSNPITREMVDQAEAFWKAHGEPFNRQGWEYIVDQYDGYLPLIIKAAPEGSVIPTRNALVTIENTDPNCFWLTSYIETALLRAIWYPTTAATNSWSIKQTLIRHMQETADSQAQESVNLMLHDFGARGASSMETAGIGDAAHLVNFMGTDTVTGALYAQRYYNEENVVAISVPASEHSTMTAWGKEGEKEAFRNMLKQFGGDFPIISVVSDSYDIFNAVSNLWGEELREQVQQSGSMLVVRPDSGDPVDVVTKIVHLLDSKFGHTMNDKGYRVLNGVRVLQGDGITEQVIDEILYSLRGWGYSAENMVFGLGGGLLQDMNRDTCKFAYKASAIQINGVWHDVYKDPVTDSGKASKKGRLMLYKDDQDRYVTAREAHNAETAYKPVLQPVFVNGQIRKQYTFTEVRRRSEQSTM